MHALAHKPSSDSSKRSTSTSPRGEAGSRQREPAPNPTWQRLALSGPLLQRSCCASCASSCEADETLRRSPAPGPTGPTSTPAIVGQVLRAAAPRLERSVAQRVAGKDHEWLQDVRIHTDAQADASARAVGARAYTVGRDIVFRRGQYAPDGDSGRRLLAHELEHVRQQGARAYAGGRIEIGAVDHPAEAAAERAEPTNEAEAPILRRTPDGPVHLVRMSCADSVIAFDTPSGSHVYHLNACNLPIGNYTVGVTTTATSFHFDFGQAASNAQQFNFSFAIRPSQANPATMLAEQRQVPVQVLERIPTEQAPTGELSTRLQSFKNLVIQAGVVRMNQNIANLDAWATFLNERLTPAQVQSQVHAEETRHLIDRAFGNVELGLAEQWMNTTRSQARRGCRQRRRSRRRTRGRRGTGRCCSRS